MDEINERILNAINEFATEGIQVTDAQGNYLFCNRAFSLITSLPITDRLGHNVLDVQPDGAAAAVLKTGLPVYGHINQSTDGVFMVANASPIRDEDGKMVGVVSIFNDRTSYIKLAQSLKEREDEVLKLKGKLRRLERPSYCFSDLIGKSPAFLDCICLAKKAAGSDASVLITAESGTGKELFAHAIHARSGRAEGPLVRVNCPAIPSSLIESELFGYEKGSFTGAAKEKPGKFELAQNGSIFLDEIGDLDLPLQAKLLRVLQEREIERIGATHATPLNVRVIAATNCNLHEQVGQGKFRQDLYYRLNVIHIELPPLRRRREDIPLLFEHMLKKHGTGAVPCSISRDAMRVLVGYDWPGNVRELENIAERLLLYREGPVIQKSDVLHVLGDCGDRLVREELEELSLARLEKLAIQRAVKRYGTSLEGKKQAAAALGISLSGLYKKLKQYQGGGAN